VTSASGNLQHHLSAHHLMLAGVVKAPHLLPEGAACVVLLSPDEPHWWTHVQQSAEWHDGTADPIDRWSARVLSDLAKATEGRAILPSVGPPYAPFYQWAVASGRTFASPVQLLVHDVAGLFISFRGALALPFVVEDSPRGPSPCGGCSKPCLTACPVGALVATGYDVPACHGFLDTAAGDACLSGGCAVRRACPVGAERRAAAQSAHHMRYFHK